MQLESQAIRVLSEIATVQFVVEGYQQEGSLLDLTNFFHLIKAPRKLEEVHRYHIEATIARGQAAALDAIAVHAAMPEGNSKIVLNVMAQRLEVALNELATLIRKTIPETRETE